MIDVEAYVTHPLLGRPLHAPIEPVTTVVTSGPPEMDGVRRSQIRTAAAELIRRTQHAREIDRRAVGYEIDKISQRWDRERGNYGKRLPLSALTRERLVYPVLIAEHGDEVAQALDAASWPEAARARDSQHIGPPSLLRLAAGAVENDPLDRRSLKYLRENLSYRHPFDRLSVTETACLQQLFVAVRETMKARATDESVTRRDPDVLRTAVKHLAHKHGFRSSRALVAQELAQAIRLERRPLPMSARELKRHGVHFAMRTLAAAAMTMLIICKRVSQSAADARYGACLEPRMMHLSSSPFFNAAPSAAASCLETMKSACRIETRGPASGLGKLVTVSGSVGSILTTLGLALCTLDVFWESAERLELAHRLTRLEVELERQQAESPVFYEPCRLFRPGGSRPTDPHEPPFAV